MAIDFALIRIEGQRAIEGQRSKSEGQRAPTESDGSSIGQSLEMMDILLRHYEQQKVCFKAKLGIFINKLLEKVQLASFSKQLNASCY